MKLEIKKESFLAQEGFVAVHLTPSECETYGFKDQDLNLDAAGLADLRNTVWKVDQCLSVHWHKIANAIGELAKRESLWQIPYVNRHGTILKPRDTIHFPETEELEHRKNLAIRHTPKYYARSKSSHIILGTDNEGLIVSCPKYWFKNGECDGCPEHTDRNEIAKGLWLPDKNKNYQPLHGTFAECPNCHFEFDYEQPMTCIYCGKMFCHCCEVFINNSCCCPHCKKSYED